MRILLDTCAFLWLSSNSRHATATIRNAFQDPSNLLYLSVSSAWEIAIKHQTGQLALPTPPDQYVPDRVARYRLMLVEVGLVHALRAGSLPLHHKDPFDRMLIAQAEIEGLTIATPDRAFSPYGVPLLW